MILLAYNWSYGRKKSGIIIIESGHLLALSFLKSVALIIALILVQVIPSSFKNSYFFVCYLSIAFILGKKLIKMFFRFCHQVNKTIYKEFMTEPKFENKAQIVVQKEKKKKTNWT